MEIPIKTMERTAAIRPKSIYGKMAVDAGGIKGIIFGKTMEF